MRRIRYSVAMSLDGYIAGPNGEYDWIPMDPDIDFRALFGRFDTVFLGRKSYEASKRQGHPATGLPTFVFSRTLRQEDCPGVIVSADPAAVIAGLKGTPGRDVWLFGPLVSTVLRPMTKMFEYKVSGTISEPKLEPVYVLPRLMLMPLQPVRTIKGLFQGVPSTNRPAGIRAAAAGPVTAAGEEEVAHRPRGG